MKRSIFITGILGLALIGISIYVPTPKNDDSSTSRSIASDGEAEEIYLQKICRQEEKIHDLEAKIEKLLAEQKSALEILRSQRETPQMQNPLLRMPQQTTGLFNPQVMAINSQPIHYGPTYSELLNHHSMQRKISRDFRDIPLYKSQQTSQRPIVQNFYYGNSKGRERASIPGFKYERQIVPTYRRNPANNAGQELFGGSDSFQFSQTSSPMAE